MGEETIASSSGNGPSDFELRYVTLEGERTGALLFVAASAERAQKFLRQMIGAMFPPGGRSSSLLSVETRDNGVLLYEVRSHAGLAKIALTGVPHEVGMLVRDTLQEFGSLPIVFGFYDGSTVVLIDPRENHVIKTDAHVDDGFISGTGVHDWSDFIAGISRDNQTVPADVEI